MQPDELDGLGSVSQLVQRNRRFDFKRQRGLTPSDYLVWNRIGTRSTIADLVRDGGVASPELVGALRRLHSLGAVVIGSEEEEFEIVDEIDLGRLSAEENRLLAEEVELLPWEKRRILAVMRTVKEGNFFDLLGVPPTATKRDVKRAYFDLSKQYHPDRYYGRELGSYRELLAQIFGSLTDAMRALTTCRSAPGGPRRRTADRYQFAARVRVSCASWSELLDLTTRDVSEDGIFVVTDAVAAPGDRVELTITLPNHGLLPLRGTVVRRDERGESGAAEVPGLGIQLDPLRDSERMRLGLLLSAAQRRAPSPLEVVSVSTSPGDKEGGRRRLARGSGPIARPAPTVGIDFGTSYTSVSASIDNRITVLPWPDGRKLMPSVVAFPSRAQFVVGSPARDRLLYDPKHTIASVKRLLGRKVTDDEVECHLAQAPYATSAGPDGSVVVEMWGERYATAQICSYIMSAAREAAQRALEARVERAVLTVPVGYSDGQVAMIRRAAEIAQLDVVDVVDEPSAASLAYRNVPGFGGLIGVYDFGGGTFDFSLVDASAGDFRVLETAGDSWLGGDDFDLALADAVANHFWRVSGVDLRRRAVEWQYLVFACEQAKRHLSDAEHAHVYVPDVARTAAGPEDLRMRIKRGTAERLWVPLVERSVEACARALRRRHISADRLDAIYLSGGTSHVPAVRRALLERFAVPVRVAVPPEFAACLGAGVHAAQIDRQRAARTSSLSLTL